MTAIRLYGMPASLYTAKPRAYLRKQGIAFDERPVGDPEFERIRREVGRWIIPVAEFPDGTLIQDGAVIIDHFAATHRARVPAFPATPVHRVVSHIFELFGGEGLLRPAMHYRWNFDAENLAFLRQDFVAALAPYANDAEADAFFADSSTRMRAATAVFGVRPDTFAAVEASYREFLARFDAHLATAPYLLGGHPTIGDYGLTGALYGHLARDPAPTRLMKTVARRVWRWTERMNAPEPSLDGFHPAGEALFASDAVPPTLGALLAFVAEDYLPELAAHVAFANAWLDARPDLVAGTNGLDRPGTRGIGMAEFDWRGHRITTAVMPYRFWLLQRIQDAADGADPEGRARIAAVLASAGLSDLLTLRTRRRVERAGHLEVWGPLR